MQAKGILPAADIEIHLAYFMLERTVCLQANSDKGQAIINQLL